MLLNCHWDLQPIVTNEIRSYALRIANDVDTVDDIETQEWVVEFPAGVFTEVV